MKLEEHKQQLAPKPTLEPVFDSIELEEINEETEDDEFVGDEEGSEELVGGDDVAVEGAGEEGGGSGGDADDVGGGGAFGAEELEFGEDEVVGVIKK